MKHVVKLTCATALALMTVGCVESQWRIVQSERSYRDEDSRHRAVNTILINPADGSTWMLYPITGNAVRNDDEDDHGYSWVPIPTETWPPGTVDSSKIDKAKTVVLIE